MEEVVRKHIEKKESRATTAAEAAQILQQVTSQNDESSPSLAGTSATKKRSLSGSRLTNVNLIISSKLSLGRKPSSTNSPNINSPTKEPNDEK